MLFLQGNQSGRGAWRLMRGTVTITLLLKFTKRCEVVAGSSHLRVSLATESRTHHRVGGPSTWPGLILGPAPPPPLPVPVGGGLCAAFHPCVCVGAGLLVPHCLSAQPADSKPLWDPGASQGSLLMDASDPPTGPREPERPDTATPTRLSAGQGLLHCGPTLSLCRRSLLVLRALCRAVSGGSSCPGDKPGTKVQTRQNSSLTCPGSGVAWASISSSTKWG